MIEYGDDHTLSKLSTIHKLFRDYLWTQVGRVNFHNRISIIDEIYILILLKTSNI